MIFCPNVHKQNSFFQEKRVEKNCHIDKKIVLRKLVKSYSSEIQKDMIIGSTLRYNRTVIHLFYPDSFCP